MSHANEALLDANYAAWCKHDVDLILQNFDPEAVYEDTAFGVVNVGHEGIRNFATEVFATQLDFQVRYKSRFATDTRGAGEWIINAVWQGEFEGVDVSGTKIEFSGLSIYEFRNGKILRNIDCWDPTVLMRQFGVLSQDLKSLV